MLNRRFIIGILVMALTFGITVIANADEGGTFTLTDIPSRFNGMYAVFLVEEPDIMLVGAESIDMDIEYIIASRILDGRVSFPMWIFDEDVDSLSRYDGNHSDVEVWIAIFDSELVTMDDDEELIAVILFYEVTFSNGSAEKSFHDVDSFTRL